MAGAGNGQDEVVEVVEVLLELVTGELVFRGGMSAKKLTAPPTIMTITATTTMFLGEKANHRMDRDPARVLIRILPNRARIP